MNGAIPENIFQSLGSSTYWFLVSKKSSPGFVFLILALIIAIMRAQGFIATQFLSIARTGSWVLFVIAIFSLAIAFISSGLVYRTTAFMLTSDAFKLKRGVFKNEEFAIPYRQIQNVEISRTIGQRILGLARFEIETAGEENEPEDKDEFEGVISAMDAKVAEVLRDELIRRANIQKTVEVKPV
ncbi:MAG TPA: PH domain-containing protein [Candidatus Paceibacterota bacterium]|jgi:Predicted membrane protein